MKKRPAFAVVEFLVALVVIGLIAGLVYWAVTKSSSKTASTSPTPDAAVENKLAEIKSKLSALDHNSIYPDDNGVASDDVLIPLTTASYVVHSPADFSVNYDSSLLKGKTTALGSTDGIAREANALDREAVRKILKDAGLKSDTLHGTEPSITEYYLSDLVACSMSDSMGYAEVSCSDAATVWKYIADSERAEQALKRAVSGYSPQEVGAQIYVIPSKKGSALGLLFQGLGSKVDDAYMIRTNGTWEYLASSTQGRQGMEWPSCAIVDKPEYESIFSVYCTE